MHRRIMAAILPLAAGILSACGGSPSDGAATDLTAAQVSASPKTIEARTARRLKIGQASPVVVRTAPAASCTLHSDEPQSKGEVKLDADDDGYVQFHLRPDVPAPAATFLLDCTEPGGATSTYALDITADDRGDGLTPARAAASTSTVRPPLEGDLDAPSQGELVSHGYPPRPDARRSPSAYAQWRELVTRPYAIVSPRKVAHPERRPGDTQLSPRPHAESFGPGYGNGNGTSPNWSGAVMTNPFVRYWIANANWRIPTLYDPPTPYGIFVPADAAEWVGLDGWNSAGSLVQAGSDSYQATVVSWGPNGNYVYTIIEYSAWIENFPSPPWYIPNFSVWPNDEMTVNVFLADQNGSTWFSSYNGDITPQDDTVWFLVHDTTQGLAYAGTLPRPSSFAGVSADFIIEDAEVDLANFEYAGMWNAEFGDGEWGSMPIYDNGPPWDGTLNQINMTSSSDTMDAVAVWGSTANGNPGSIFFVWENPN